MGMEIKKYCVEKGLRPLQPICIGGGILSFASQMTVGFFCQLLLQLTVEGALCCFSLPSLH